MEFDNLFELLESVRMYPLRTKEQLIPFTSVTGTVLGYTTADSAFQSVTWTISAHAAKRTARERGTREAQRIQELFVSHMGRRQLLVELRAGELEYGIYRAPEPEEPLQEPTASGPRQLLLPL
jgi:hypothetical protein